jgi:hypothetical protein
MTLHFLMKLNAIFICNNVFSKFSSSIYAMFYHVGEAVEVEFVEVEDVKPQLGAVVVVLAIVKTLGNRSKTLNQCFSTFFASRNPFVKSKLSRNPYKHWGNPELNCLQVYRNFLYLISAFLLKDCFNSTIEYCNSLSSIYASKNCT